MDRKWWNEYGDEIAPGPELWTTHREAAKTWELNYIRGEPGGGMSGRDGVLRMGGNSGFQAVQLALNFGADRIILLGYDMQATHGRSHFFGDHKSLGNPVPSKMHTWHRAFAEMPHMVRKRIFNATRETALRCFVRRSLDDCLAESAA